MTPAVGRAQPVPAAVLAAAFLFNLGQGRLLAAVLRTPGVLLMSVTNAALIAIQTGVLVFLFPLYWSTAETLVRRRWASSSA